MLKSHSLSRHLAHAFFCGVLSNGDDGDDMLTGALFIANQPAILENQVDAAAEIG